MSNSFVAEGLMQLEQALSSQTLIDAEALIPKGDFQAVYQLLQPFKGDRADDVECFYLWCVKDAETAEHHNDSAQIPDAEIKKIDRKTTDCDTEN